MNCRTTLRKVKPEEISIKMSYPNDYFDVNIKVMRIATVWYSKDESKLYKFYSIFCFVYCIVFCTPSEFVSLVDTWRDINALVMNLGIALTHGIASLKVINWYIRRKEILLLMEILQDQQYHYKPTKNFKPGMIIEKAKQTNITLTKMFFLIANMIPVSSYILAIINYFFRPHLLYTIDENGSTEFCKKLPFYSWIPFERSTDFSCFMAIIFQSYPFTYLTVMIVAMDTLYMGLINYATAHLLVLQEAFRDLRSSALSELSRENEQNELLHDDELLEMTMMKHMKKCIIHFQTIQR